MKKIPLTLGITLACCVFANEAQANPLAQVKAASQQWVKEFNQGNAQYLGSRYTMNAVMITHPIGSFHGRPDITAFWVKLIKDGAKELIYIDPKYTVIDDKTVHITSKWKMNIGSGIITLEQWVKEPDGVWRLKLDDFTIQKQMPLTPNKSDNVTSN